MAFGLREAICLECGEGFSGRFSPERRFCSVACRQRYRNHPDRNPARSEEAKAKISAAMHGNRSCVGRVLSAETRQKIAQSLTGKPTPPDVIAKRVASMKATMRAHGGRTPAQRRYDVAPRLSGPAHHSWKGGTTPARGREFATQEYKAFHRAVLERDGYTCQSCGAKNGMGQVVRLEVHHVRSYAEHPELRFDPDNGQTLCFACHRGTLRGTPRTPRVDFVPKPRECAHCGREFRIRSPRKFCPDCRAMLCCPRCGSRTCGHKERRALAYYSQPD